MQLSMTMRESEFNDLWVAAFGEEKETLNAISVKGVGVTST